MAAIALFAGLGLAAFDDLIAVAIGARHGYEYHGHLLFKGASTIAYFPVKVQN